MSRWQIHWRPRITYSIYLVDTSDTAGDDVYLGVTDVDIEREWLWDQLAHEYDFDTLKGALESDEASAEWDRQGIDEEYVRERSK